MAIQPSASEPTPSAARWEDGRFDAERERVLAGWKTGAEVDFDEAVQFHKSRPHLANVPHKRAWAKETGNILLQPLAGVTTLRGHMALMQHLQDEGTADILPCQIDSLTRNLKFADAEAAIAVSERDKIEKLNGFPIVNHGVRGTRQMVEALHVPVEMRIGSVWPELAAEIAFASGLSSITAGPIYYTAHYSRDVTFAAGIARWQYVFRLIGRYREHGADIGCQIHGIGNATPFTNTVLGVCCVLETLIAAAQGARSFSLDARFMGSMAQDAAAVRAIREFAQDTLHRFGYDDAIITIDRKDWAGRYPEDPNRAFGLTCYNAMGAALAGANEIISKSIEQAIGIPTKEGNANTLKGIRQVVGLMRNQHILLDPEAIDTEVELMRLEMDAILEAVLELGNGDPAAATARAFETGLLDIPFSASNHTKGEVMVARDSEGAVRYLNPGRLPVPERVLKYHRACLDKRVAARKQPIDYQAIVDDIFSISQGRLVAD